MEWDEEDLLTLSAASRLIPGRTGKGIAVSTLWRWITRGCRGIKLESVVIGHQRYVSRESLRKFVGTINGSVDVNRAPEERASRHKEIEAMLDNEWNDHKTKKHERKTSDGLPHSPAKGRLFGRNPDQEETW